jgi:hypothetical protein
MDPLTVGLIAGGGSALMGAVSGIFSSKSKKKRQAELDRQMAELAAKVASSQAQRLRDVDKLTEEQI